MGRGADQVVLSSTVPVSELNLDQYGGRWYQMFGNLLSNSTFERNGFCCTADYGLISSSEISVLNAQNTGSPTGKLSTIKGTATHDARKPAGELGVKFAGMPFTGPYWIVKLGPVQSFNGVEQYSYAVVSDEFKVSLYVLARDVSQFRDTQQSEVLDWLKSNGWDGLLNRPVQTFQGPECDYLPVPSQ